MGYSDSNDDNAKNKSDDSIMAKIIIRSLIYMYDDVLRKFVNFPRRYSDLKGNDGDFKGYNNAS